MNWYQSEVRERGRERVEDCHDIGITIGEVTCPWAAAGDQVVLTITGIDQSKLT